MPLKKTQLEPNKTYYGCEKGHYYETDKRGDALFRLCQICGKILTLVKENDKNIKDAIDNSDYNQIGWLVHPPPPPSLFPKSDNTKTTFLVKKKEYDKSLNLNGFSKRIV